MQKYKLIRYNKKKFLVIMAKEIKINKRLIIDGKEQGCDLLKIHYLCGDKDNFKVFFIAIMSQLFEVTSPMNLH